MGSPRRSRRCYGSSWQAWTRRCWWSRWCWLWMVRTSCSCHILGASTNWSDSRTVEVATTRLVEKASGALEPETYYETEYHSKPAGWNGSNGWGGVPHLSSLHDGSHGLNGTFSFFVRRRNGNREQYHGCYNLTLSAFEMVDDNDDGIYEPGEHVLIRGIQIYNSGIVFPAAEYLSPVLIRVDRTYALPVSLTHTSHHTLVHLVGRRCSSRQRPSTS